MPHYVFFVFHFWRVTTKSGSHGIGRRGEKNQASSVVVATASSLRKLPNVYRIPHPRGLKLLTRLRLGLSHLREHKFRHNFNDTSGTNNLETSEHFLLHCPTYLTWIKFRVDLISRTTKIFNSAWIKFRSWPNFSVFRVDLISRFLSKTAKTAKFYPREI